VEDLDGSEVGLVVDPNTLGDVFWKRYHTRELVDDWQSEASKDRTNRQLHDDYLYLEGRIEKLTLICRALFELLQKEHGWDEDKLMAKVAEVDLRDGSLDGRLAKPIFDCPECGRKVNARHGRCLYCGADNFHRDPFVEV